MQTLAVYNMIASAFAEEIKKSDTSSKEAYEASLENAKQKAEDMARKLRDIDPVLSPIVFPGEESLDIDRMIKTIEKRAELRKELGTVFTGTTFSKVIQRVRMVFPKYIDFSAKPHILIEPYKDQKWEDFAVKVMNQILLGCLLSLPKGKVRIDFINPSLSNKSATISSRLPSDMYKIFIEKKEILDFTASLTSRIKETLRKGAKPELPAYEIVVLLDYPYRFDSLTEDMRLLIEQGQQAGIHFVVLNDLRRNFESKQSYDILSLKDEYFQEFGAFNDAKKEDYDSTLFLTYQIFDQPVILQNCFDYLNNETKENSSSELVESETEYAAAENGLKVPVGKPIDRKTMEFSLGQDGHVHSFIIGQTGKGKSVLLNNIIIKAIQKYSPEDLQLYLLDLKLGGVGFNRYKEVKHVRALLVDNTDIQIILEILRDLSEQMYKRGNLLRETGVEKIDDYNKANPDNRMSRIWVVIDECHVLFEHNSNSEGKAMREISKILSKVATEGRNQGVHLIMATQTLANSDIPTEILNQFTDRYILNCAHNDSERLCSDSSRLTSKFGKGDVYYHNTGDIPDTQFHTFYISEEETKSQISTAVAKAEQHKSNGQFYFNGSLLFNIDKEILDRIGEVRNNNLIACVGKSISLHQEPVLITLKKDFGENILLTGIDEKNQSTRTASDILFSLIASNVLSGNYYKFYVFDYRKEEDVENQDIFDQLEEAGLITVLRNKTIGSQLKKIVSNIKNERLCPTIILVLSQQRSRELKLNLLIKEDDTNQELKGGWFGKNGFINPPKVETESSKEVKTYIDALCYILDNGPDYHIHTILQVDKPDNLLFQDFFPRNYIFSKFRHLIMLHSDDKAATKLGVSDEMRLDKLNSENERLRAIYYADGDDGWTLFSPFVKPNKELILSITNKEQ